MGLFSKPKSELPIELPIVRKARAPAPPLGDAMEGAILPGTQRSAASPHHAPRPLNGHPAAEIRLRLGDLLYRIPSHFLKPGPHDGKRELLFQIGDLSSDISRGRATIPLSRIVQLCPDIFCENPALSFAVDIHLPLQKLVEQIGAVPLTPSASPTVAPTQVTPIDLSDTPETKSPPEAAAVQSQPASAENAASRLDRSPLARDPHDVVTAQTSEAVLMPEPRPILADTAPAQAPAPELPGVELGVAKFTLPPNTRAAELTPIVAVPEVADTDLPADFALASSHDSAAPAVRVFSPPRLPEQIISAARDSSADGESHESRFAATEPPWMKVPPPPLIQPFPLASTLASGLFETKPSLPVDDFAAAESAAELRQADPPIAARPAFIPPPKLSSAAVTANPPSVHLAPSSQAHSTLPHHADHRKLADVIAGWVGIDACVIVGPGGTASAGVVPKGFAAAELETAARQLLGFIDQYPIEGGHFRNFNLHYAHTSLTVISNGEHLLCVFHRDHVLDSALRDQLQESARGLT